MSREIPRVLALHDLSGFGRCALTVIIPAMSRLGVQVCPVPTAVMSTHTGGFENFAFSDMTDFMRGALTHYRSLGITFEGVYSGFLGSAEQCAIVREYQKTFGGFVLTDPVLGDHGSLYSTVTDALVQEMRGLLTDADLITPNVTEGAYLLEESVRREYSREEAIGMAKRLCGFGAKICALTGVHLIGHPQEVFSVLYHRADGTAELVGNREISGEYPGAGDLFASILLSRILRGGSPADGVREASDAVGRAILSANRQQTPLREGLPIERTEE